MSVGTTGLTSPNRGKVSSKIMYEFGKATGGRRERKVTDIWLDQALPTATIMITVTL